MLWIGFALAVLAFVTYFSLFVEFPLTRNVPWVNLLLFGLAAVLLVLGMGSSSARTVSRKNLRFRLRWLKRSDIRLIYFYDLCRSAQAPCICFRAACRRERARLYAFQY